MGIDNSAMLIVGWEIDYKCVKKWKEELKYSDCCCKSKVGHVKSDPTKKIRKPGDVCDCMIEYMNDEDQMPEKFIICSSSPHYDCPVADRGYYLCYNMENDETSLEDFAEVLKDKEAFEKAQEFANKMGCQEESPLVFPVPDIT